ncbi:hypothetical protein SBA1_200016 [Candidatus Sulfotelmatobacter kueseliae]|uniref:Uncharacterized protein n=1 Tax=Candidatus Sulfotelmatobacter kueseliae TaxID=2042962 RepID=A0A2U3KGM7_9BACT|nr:hypothetical protein SBA1_200016 [Candidatus Sulfotelmatobacter kueseliae]
MLYQLSYIGSENQLSAIRYQLSAKPLLRVALVRMHHIIPAQPAFHRE